MKITWHGHACFTVETAVGSAVLDPYAPGSVPGLSLPELSADEVICSHGHDDHNAAGEIRLTGKTPGYGKVQIPCFHDDRRGTLRGSDLITVIEAEGLRAVHMGDLGHELSPEQLAAVGRPDVLMIPVGGFYTVDVKTAARIAKALAARIVIPMHYRGAGFGYDVLSTEADFVSEFDGVRRLDGNVLEVGKETAGGVYVLKCPVK